MSGICKKLSYVFIFSLIGIMTACAPAKKNPINAKRKQSSHVNASQLGRNSFYFSPGYQKKLTKKYKKK